MTYATEGGAPGPNDVRITEALHKATAELPGEGHQPHLDSDVATERVTIVPGRPKTIETEAVTEVVAELPEEGYKPHFDPDIETEAIEVVTGETPLTTQVVNLRNELARQQNRISLALIQLEREYVDTYKPGKEEAEVPKGTAAMRALDAAGKELQSQLSELSISTGTDEEKANRLAEIKGTMTGYRQRVEEWLGKEK